MKKFIKKILILCLIVLVCLVSINQAYIGLKYDNFNEINKGIQISNSGSSHGMFDFCYEDLEEYNCFNFGYTSQSLSYDYRVLLEYEEYLEKDGIMFIPLSYFSFYGYNETDQEGFESKNKRYYEILSKKNIKNYQLKNAMLLKYFPILDAQYNILIVFSGKSRAINDKTWNTVATESGVQADAEAAYKRHVTDYNGIVNQEEIDALYNIVQLCKDKNIRPVLVTTPYLNEYTELASESFLEGFYDLINRVQIETGVEYYDYSNDARFSNAYGLFMNSDHLNMEGAKKFVSVLKDEIIDKH